MLNIPLSVTRCGNLVQSVSTLPPSTTLVQPNGLHYRQPGPSDCSARRMKSKIAQEKEKINLLCPVIIRMRDGLTGRVWRRREPSSWLRKGCGQPCVRGDTLFRPYSLFTVGGGGGNGDGGGDSGGGGGLWLLCHVEKRFSRLGCLR